MTNLDIKILFLGMLKPVYVQCGHISDTSSELWRQHIDGSQSMPFESFDFNLSSNLYSTTLKSGRPFLAYGNDASSREK